jgi:hypothetical protein
VSGEHVAVGSLAFQLGDLPGKGGGHGCHGVGVISE